MLLGFCGVLESGGFLDSGFWGEIFREFFAFFGGVFGEIGAFYGVFGDCGEFGVVVDGVERFVERVVFNPLQLSLQLLNLLSQLPRILILRLPLINLLHPRTPLLSINPIYRVHTII